MELTQALVGVDIGLGIILLLKVVGLIVDHFEDKAAQIRMEQMMREHPMSTATPGRQILSGTEHQ